MSSSEGSALSGVPWNAGVGKLLQRVADQLSDLVLGVDSSGGLYYVSPSVEAILGYSPEDFRRLYNRALAFSADARFRMLQDFVQERLQGISDLLGEEQVPETLVLNHRDGFRVTLQVRCTTVQGRRGESRGAVCVCRDLTSRRDTFASTALATRIFENSLTAIYITNNQGRLVQVNRAFSRLTGYDSEFLTGQKPELLGADFASAEFTSLVASELQASGVWEGQALLRRRDGSVFAAAVHINQLRDESGRVLFNVGCFSDAEEDGRCQSGVGPRAFLDALTRLPNRSLCLDRLERAIARARRGAAQIAVLYINVDDFQSINEALGCEVGDSVLRQVGERIRCSLRSGDSVARLGGDAFVVLLEDLRGGNVCLSDAAAVVAKVRSVIGRPYRTETMELALQTSIGVACCPLDGSDAEQLLQRAEVAMQRVKASGGDGVQFYSQAISARVYAGVQLAQGVPEALSRDQFELCFQPIVCPRTDAVVGQEALLRWQHPLMGSVLPEEFIAHAERAGHIKMLGAWVLEEVGRQWQQWQQQGCRVPVVTVNLSVEQLRDDDIVQTLQAALERYGMPAGALLLELRAAHLQRRGAVDIEVLEQLLALGVGLSVEGFGDSGLALEALRQLPLAALKLSPRLIKGLPDEQGRRLLRGVVALAREMGTQVVALGVETPAQLEAVQAVGCDGIQGYLLSRPVPAAQVAFA
ncbi:EAL domain-containing protein [Pseudomaricurvus sp. HS19]|uniref:sensor domain-containing protein n=1 Tax=Pseudomaricurvus sp. HS19 TaxID=2692626 RepID=UPI00136E19F2|nr:EAL domain-containing protein [Pseudomaricurvus sp. HS19]MYM63302.1 EAL domain-containing protein [Pseudomaricurvus sp. HS19]